MEELIKTLENEIPNLYDFYSKKEVVKIIQSLGSVTQENVTDLFINDQWDYPIRRCSVCGELMIEGFLLGDEYYACCDNCRNEIYKRAGAKDDDEAYRNYLLDYYDISDDEVEGMSNEEIEEVYKDAHALGNVMWTQWY